MSARTGIRIGVVVAREPNPSPWAEHVWRPLEVIHPAPADESWQPMRELAGGATFMAGCLDIVLHRKEAASYLDNLCEANPALWVVLRAREGEVVPLEPHLVTPSLEEVQAYGVSGDEVIGPVPMPAAIRDLLAAFAAEHYAEDRFVKRVRNNFGREEAPKFGKEPIFGERNRQRRTGQGENGT